MASASFRSVGHVQPALWPRGCYCKYDWPQVDVLGCQIYRFLALLCRCSRSDTFTPSNGTPHPTSYTQGWQTLPQVLPAVPTVVSRLFNFPAPRCRPHSGKVHTRERWPPIPLSQDGFLREAMLFFKSISRLSSKGLFHCSSSIGRGAQKVNNQF